MQGNTPERHALQAGAAPGGAEGSLAVLQHEKFQSAPGSRVGTPAYLAPEVIMTTKGQTYDGKVRPLLLQTCMRMPASLRCVAPRLPWS
jgi:hypothetical protein